MPSRCFLMNTISLFGICFQSGTNQAVYNFWIANCMCSLLQYVQVLMQLDAPEVKKCSSWGWDNA